jgi:hypothetical protein
MPRELERPSRRPRAEPRPPPLAVKTEAPPWVPPCVQLPSLLSDWSRCNACFAPWWRAPSTGTVKVLERFLPRRVLIFLGIGAGAAFVIGLIGAILRSDSAGSVVLSAFEAAVLAFVGGLLARSFISVVLRTGRDAPNVAYVLGWAFFLWPGVIDTIPRLMGKQYATRPVVLLWLATSVGAFTGMMDGLWQTHQWVGPGVVAFALDETWGLAGSTQGDLVHLVNFTWGDHVVGETRTDAHRYKSGFAVQSGFAFTQGAVMSSNKSPAGTPLFSHENTHVWQNRVFGPFFTLSYIAWLIVLLIPGLIYGLASGAGGGVGIQSFSYFSNPWEAWAYSVQGVNRTTFAAGIWPDLAVGIVSVPFFALVLVAAVWIVYRVWSRARASP